MAAPGYAYFDHGADMGIVGHGPTLEAAMEGAAQAVFALMVDPQAVRAAVAVQVEFEEPDPELALVTWLNRLLTQARVAGLALGRFRLDRHDGQWRGEGWGEPWHPEMERGVEVKGATLTMLAVARVGDGWEARCVVDV